MYSGLCALQPLPRYLATSHLMMLFKEDSVNSCRTIYHVPYRLRTFNKLHLTYTPALQSSQVPEHTPAITTAKRAPHQQRHQARPKHERATPPVDSNYTPAVYLLPLWPTSSIHSILINLLPRCLLAASVRHSSGLGLD